MDRDGLRMARGSGTLTECAWLAAHRLLFYLVLEIRVLLINNSCNVNWAKTYTRQPKIHRTGW